MCLVTILIMCFRLQALDPNDQGAMCHWASTMPNDTLHLAWINMDIYTQIKQMTSGSAMIARLVNTAAS